MYQDCKTPGGSNKQRCDAQQAEIGDDGMARDKVARYEDEVVRYIDKKERRSAEQKWQWKCGAMMQGEMSNGSNAGVEEA
ncbi:uncharacterized protein DS421_3g92580 [Arachis hypogaea]|nr:uncharacterized protein DS421_3g92580 [Arachis hypogaea]